MTSAVVSPEERQLLTEVRKRAKRELELCPQYDDDFSLMRWLVAWDRKIDVIVPKLIFSIRAANALGLNKMDLDTVEKVTVACNNSSEALQYLPGSLIGFDKEGYIVYLDVMGRLEATDLVRCVSNSECYIMKIIESFGIMEIIRDKEKKAGRPLGSAIIFDLQGLGFSQLAVFNQFTPIIQFLQDMFPDVIRKFYVINAPTFVQVLYKMVSPVLAKQTREKLKVLGSDYKDILKEDIGKDVMFEHWGGRRKAESEFGNIKMGGKPPERLRKDNKEEVPAEELTKLTVSARSTYFVPIKLERTVPGRKLKWWWLLDSGDVNFSVLRAADGQEDVPESEDDYLCYPRFKLHTDYVPESGKILAEEPGVYKFVFDNTHSFLRSKTIRYRIQIE